MGATGVGGLYLDKHIKAVVRNTVSQVPVEGLGSQALFLPHFLCEVVLNS